MSTADPTNPILNRCTGAALLLVLAIASMPLSAATTERFALVIGNAAYRGEAPLQNTRNDARDMAELLRGMGFELAGGGALLDADRDQMARATNRFLSQVQQRDGIALIYYSGHGMRDRHDANYLIPIDAVIEQEPDVRAAGIALSDILDQLNARPNDAISLVIVDACRNNPFATGLKGGKRGLGRVHPASGTLALYAASPGQQADDNPSGRNGLFTRHLLAQLAKPGLDIEDAFDAVALAVKRDSGGQQLPWSGGNLLGKVFLAGEAPRAAQDPDVLAWQAAERCGRPACYQAYLQDFPAGRFAAMARALSEAPNRMTTASSRPPAARVDTNDGCESCHPKTGPLRDPAVPEIRGNDPIVFVDYMLSMGEGARLTNVEAHKGLSDSEIERYAERYAGLRFQPRPFPFDASRAKQGALLHDKYCEKCHIEGGRPVYEEEDYIILAGQSPTFLRWRLNNMRSGVDLMAKKMRKKLDQLLQDEGESGIDDLFHYYASQGHQDW